ncbi:DNA polymerase III subunit delta' [Wandonia haliotis]|uniref:DNA polymerase III subunit delta n=1 Tax=Wandonia haliotis TaxID=574963 RepID=A0ABN1ML79_9FLAO
MQFKDVIGQEGVKKHLVEEVSRNRISHAQLLLGNPGFGGLPIALAFAQYILCSNRTETDSCGTCPSCQKVSQLQHPDLHFSFPTVLTLGSKSDLFLGNWRQKIKENPYFNLNQWTLTIDEKGRKPVIGTDESQEIIKKLSLKSFEGGYKIMMIWMAEEMNTTCSNKLLKILEEPPEKTLFILLVENADSILPTILSRTQLVKLNRIPDDLIKNELKTRFNLNEQAAASQAALANGDWVEALELSGEHQQKDINRELFVQCMRVCYKKDVIAMIQWAEKMASVTKEDQKNFLRYALHMFRQSILNNYVGDQMTRVSEEEADFLKNFSRFITGNNIQEFMKEFSDAHYHLERNANAKILFTDLCFKVMRYIHFA